MFSSSYWRYTDRGGNSDLLFRETCDKTFVFYTIIVQMLVFAFSFSKWAHIVKKHSGFLNVHMLDKRFSSVVESNVYNRGVVGNERPLAAGWIQVRERRDS